MKKEEVSRKERKEGRLAGRGKDKEGGPSDKIDLERRAGLD